MIILSEEKLCELINKAVNDAMPAAINVALHRTLKLVDGKSAPGCPVIREESVNIIDFVAKYLPDIERSLIGVQSQISIMTAAAMEKLEYIGNRIDGTNLIENDKKQLTEGD